MFGTTDERVYFTLGIMAINIEKLQTHKWKTHSITIVVMIVN